MTKTIAASGVLAFLVFSLVTCSSTSPSTGGTPAQLTGNPITYTTLAGDSTGDTILEITLQPNRCNGNNLATGAFDTTRELYKISGDSILTTNGSLTTAYYPDVALRGVTVWYVFTGGTIVGSAFSGTWTLAGAKGVPSEARTDSIVAARLPTVMSRGITFAAAGNHIQPYSSTTYASDFVASWDLLDSSLYAIKVTTVSAGEVTLFGDSSGHVATIWEDGAGNIHYSSTDSTYGPYIYYADPTSCPNNAHPVWWNEFLQANRK